MTLKEFRERYRYDIRKDKVGGGTFGTVYKAYDTILDKYCAIKVAEVKEIGDKILSLKDELDAVKDLAPNRNIANYEPVIYQFEGPSGLFDYAIMQYYPEGNLKNFIEKNKLTSQQEEEIILGILLGLQHLHKNRVIHRDLKPGNILISKHGDKLIPKITDFGLSKKAELTEGSRFSNSFGGGTLSYSAPEQLLGNKLRLNADLWAVGIIIYEIFLKERPYNANSTASASNEIEIYNKILNAPLSLEKISQIKKPYDEIIKQCLEKNPEKRVKSVNQLLELLGQTTLKEEEVDDQTLIFETPSPTLPEEKPQRKINFLIPFISAFLISIVGLALFFLRQHDQSEVIISIELFKDESTGLFGYKKGAEIIIDPLFDQAGSFADGYAEVTQKNKTYTIDESGECVKNCDNINQPPDETIEYKKEYNEELVKADKEFNKAKDENGFKKALSTYKSAKAIAEKNKISPEEAENGIKKCEQKIKSFVEVKLPIEIEEIVKLPKEIEEIENNFLFVKGGTFTMGCTSEQGGDCDKDENPTQKINVNSFYLSKYEVTQEQWKSVMKEYPKNFKSAICNRCPIENVTWDEVQLFLKKLNNRTGKRYRLPEEKEWEFAARGGTKTRGYKYAGSNTAEEVACFRKGKRGKLQQVGTLKQNELGLFDMSGNVWEWCNTTYAENYNNPQGREKTIRGGGWINNSKTCRVSDRSKENADTGHNFLGFRLAYSR